MDIQTTNAAATPPVIRREDYRSPLWLVPRTTLDFDLDPKATRVRARLEVERVGTHDQPLRLDGDGLTPLRVSVDGRALEPADWQLKEGALVIALSGPAHVVETEVEVMPTANTQLMGL